METDTPGGFVPTPLPSPRVRWILSEMNGVRATGSGAVRVLTVDDHGPFLEVAHEMIHGMPGFEAVGEVISGADAMVAADAVNPDLVLIDVHMPGMSGIEASRRLSACHPEIVVVLISTADPSELPAAARTCGAVEVLKKQDLGPGTIRRIWAEHGRPSAS